MDVFVERIAAIDIGKAELSVTVRTPQPGRPGGRRQVTRTYRTMTNALMTLREWLAAEGVTRVVMEATSVYWKPVYYLLEDAAVFEVWLVNAHHVKGVPGRRKTDHIDSAWLAKVGECELIRPSFVPPRTDPSTAGSDPPAHQPRPRPHPRGAAAGEDPGRRRDQTVRGRLGSPRRVRPGHDHRFDQRTT